MSTDPCGSIAKPRENHEAGANRAFSWVPVSRPAFGLAGADDVASAPGVETADGDVDEHAVATSASAAVKVGTERRMRSPAVDRSSGNWSSGVCHELDWCNGQSLQTVRAIRSSTVTGPDGRPCRTRAGTVRESESSTVSHGRWKSRPTAEAQRLPSKKDGLCRVGARIDLLANLDGKNFQAPLAE